MFAQPSWLGRVQWDRQCSALPLFINGSFCSCKQHEYLIRPKIPSWLMNVSQPARQPLRGHGPPGTVAKQSSRTHFTLSWTTQPFCTADRIRARRHAPTLRRSPGGNHKDKGDAECITADVTSCAVNLHAQMEICCTLVRFWNMRKVCDQLRIIYLHLSSTWMPHVPSQARRDSERERMQTDTRKLLRLRVQLVHRERAAILWRNPRQTLPQAGFQLLSITATLTAR